MIAKFQQGEQSGKIILEKDLQMYINQIISQEEKQNIFLASKESLKGYSKL